LSEQIREKIKTETGALVLCSRGYCGGTRGGHGVNGGMLFLESIEKEEENFIITKSICLREAATENHL
jgi:hypothetical protein